jgi:hypothetical protein
VTFAKEVHMKLHSIYSLVGTILAFALAFGAGCGGGNKAELTTGELPVLTSLTDAAGNPIAASGATNVMLSSLNVRFDRAADLETLASSDNIALTCDVPSFVPQPAIAVQAVAAAADSADGIVGNEFVILVKDAYLYQLASCRLTIVPDESSAATSAKAAPVDVQFESGCAVSDAFTQQRAVTNCYTLGSLPGLTSLFTTFDEVFAGVLAIDPLAGGLLYDSARNDFDTGGAFFGKDIDLGPAASTSASAKAGLSPEVDLLLIYHVRNVAGINLRPEGIPDLMTAFLCQDSTCLMFGLVDMGLGPKCVALFLEETFPGNEIDCPIGDGTNEFFLKLVLSNSQQSLDVYASYDALAWDAPAKQWYRLSQPMKLAPPPGQEGIITSDPLSYRSMTGAWWLGLAFNQSDNQSDPVANKVRGMVVELIAKGAFTSPTQDKGL